MCVQTRRCHRGMKLGVRNRRQSIDVLSIYRCSINLSMFYRCSIVRKCSIVRRDET